MKQSLSLGVIFTLLSTLSYSILAALVKQFNGELPLAQVVFIQSAISLFMTSLIMVFKGVDYAKMTLRTSHPGIHFIRSLFSLGISYFLFFAITKIPLIDAILLANTSPFMVPFLAWGLYQQKINHRLWLPIAIGFLGVFLTLKPEHSVFDIFSLLPLASALCISVAMLLIKQTSSKDSNMTICFYFFLFSTVVSASIAIPIWISLLPFQWGIMLVVGLLFFVCQFSLSLALRYTRPEIVSSLYYSNVLYSGVISLFWFHTEISFLLYVGMTLIVSCGILCIYIENKSLKSKVIFTE